MTTADSAELIDSVVKTLRIIICGLVLGLIVFIVFAAVRAPRVTRPAGNPPPVTADGKLPVFTVTAFLVAATILPLSVAIPGIFGDTLRKRYATAKHPADKCREDIPDLIRIYQVKTIMAAALSEGPAFFATIAYMVEGNPIALALALVLTAFVAIRFPVRARVEHWLEGQLVRLQSERQGAMFS